MLLYEYRVYKRNGNVTTREEGLISSIIDSLVFGGVCGPLVRDGSYFFNFYRRFNPNRPEGKEAMEAIKEELIRRGYEIEKIR